MIIGDEDEEERREKEGGEEGGRADGEPCLSIRFVLREELNKQMNK